MFRKRRHNNTRTNSICYNIHWSSTKSGIVVMWVCICMCIAVLFLCQNMHVCACVTAVTCWEAHLARHTHSFWPCLWELCSVVCVAICTQCDTAEEDTGPLLYWSVRCLIYTHNPAVACVSVCVFRLVLSRLVYLVALVSSSAHSNSQTSPRHKHGNTLQLHGKHLSVARTKLFYKRAVGDISQSDGVSLSLCLPVSLTHTNNQEHTL